MELDKYKIEIASDVNTRDGVGIEISKGGKLILKIFRDDNSKTRTITIYQKDISLGLMEESIKAFKQNIPWDFINYDEFK